MVVKSGFGTRNRIPAWLSAHEGRGFSDVFLIADYATAGDGWFGFEGRNLSVVDMVLETREAGAFPRDRPHPRLGKYDELKDAISRGELHAARALSVEFGWELDAMKVYITPYTHLLSAN